MLTRDFQQRLGMTRLSQDSSGIPRDSLPGNFYQKKRPQRKLKPNFTVSYIRNSQNIMIRLIDENEIYSKIDDKRYSLSKLVLVKEQVESELEKRIPFNEYMEESNDNNSYFTDKQIVLESQLKEYQTLIKRLWNHTNK